MKIFIFLLEISITFLLFYSVFFLNSEFFLEFFYLFLERIIFICKTVNLFKNIRKPIIYEKIINNLFDKSLFLYIFGSLNDFLLAFLQLFQLFKVFSHIINLLIFIFDFILQNNYSLVKFVIFIFKIIATCLYSLLIPILT